MVGIAARMRVSSPTAPASSNGTLKSTRTSARRSRSWSSRRSRIVCLFTGGLQFRGDVLDEVHAARRIAPLVVVPSRHLEQRAVHDVGALPVNDAGVRVADVVARNQ